ncbi:MAG: hypothetical protein BGP04_26105 [Rhizobiales bacterium 62-17]|nr:PAS domain S-box protein [Hyphomicrobiales bacterium]OJY00960.1 MAG: hypothetical protein BGP04_26105 [Rhizobiales bacterium 62-17]
MPLIPEQNPIDAETLARVLAEPPLAGLQAGNAPYFIVAGSRIIHASDSALALFRAADLAGLEKRLFAGQEPGSRRLADLSRSLVPGTATRLERLRFFFGRATQTVTFACRRLAGPTPLFVAGALDAPATLLTALPIKSDDAKVAAAALVEPAAPTPVAVELREQAALEEPIVTSAADTVPKQPETQAPPPEAAAPVEPIAATAPVTPSPRPQSTSPVRFLWQTDGERRFVKLTGALCETMGCQTADLIGQDFIAVAERFGVDRMDDLRAAFARHETWSGLRVLWPINGTQEAAPVTLGGLPTFDEDHAFNGFSGFGVINLDKIVARPTPVEAVQPSVKTQAERQEIEAEEAKTEETESDTSESQATEALASEDQAIAPSSSDDDEHDALDGARERMFAPPLPEPDYQNYAPNVVPLRDWRDRQAANTDATNAPLETPAETSPVEPAASETATPTAAEAPQITAETSQADAPEAQDSAEDKPAQEQPEPDNDNLIALSASERQAFRDIARSIVANIERGEKPKPVSLSAASDDEASQDHVDGKNSDEAAPAASHEVPATISENTAGPETIRHEIVAHEKSAPLHDDVSATPAQASAEQMREIAAALGVAGPIAVPAAELPKPLEDTMPANAAAILDRLNMGILVMHGGVPAFINRHLLDTLGFADIDAFHDWGGPERMIHGQALNEQGSDGTPLQVETRSGELVKLDGRMQTTEWDGQPATLMTFRPVETPEPVETKPAETKPAVAPAGEQIAKLESDARAQDAEIRELHAILDTATDGVAILDGSGAILSINRSAEALFGYERGEIAGQSLTTLFAKDSQKAALDYLEGLKSHGVRSVLNDGREVIGRARMGGQIPIFMTIGRIGSETAEKFCAVMRDMSDWKNAERELKDARREAEQASALKSDFLAKISHEIRTPLNAILGFAEVIIDERFGPVGNDRYKEYLRDIHASGTHVMSLVNDLLDLSKIEAGKLDLNFGAVDANKIVNECVSIMQPQSVRERVIMRLALAPHLPNIVADERSLRQIVLNILSNAVKFNQPGGQVIVSTALTDSGQAVVRVRDTGIGMSEKDLEVALEPFRQIQTARQTSGTGLGLPLTKALVEANRAAFSIKSKPGEGTLVEVTFPSTRVLAE